ncbi:MAG: DUF2490 domain-containing protein [Bacteroidota bacterium]
MPSININKGFSNDWKLNFKIESRQQTQEGIFREVNNTNFEYLLTDLSVIAAKKVGAKNSLAGGYLIRWEGDQIIHRLIQQFTLVSLPGSFRLAHRISTDQTFASEEVAELRFRYRITTDFPLNGQSVDPQELYLKINHEYLNAFQSSDYDLEVRVVPLLGYAITDNNKIEVGLDYRINSFLNASSRNSFWVSINWYIKI